MGGFVYMFLGTVKEVTIGPTSLMAIVTFQFTRDLNIHFVILLTFLTGIIQFAMGVLRLGGYITTLLPDPQREHHFKVQRDSSFPSQFLW
jgi:sodium-independent sulfate anion transporter 11